MMTNKPLIWMILFGLVRAALVWGGAKLSSHGLIDPDTHERLITEGTAQAVGYLLLVIGVGWGAVQKTQVWGWVKTALRLDSSRTNAEDVPVAAPGPNVPI